MDLITVIIVICLFSLTTLYMKTRRQKNYPPGPKTLPFIGNLNVDMSDRLKLFREYREKYGDVFSLILGKRILVVVNGMDAIHEVFVKHADVTSDRPDVFFHTDLLRGKGILSTSGSVWKEVRTYALESLRDQGMGKKSMENRIMEEVDAFLDKIGRFNGQPFDVADMVHVSTANVTCSVSFGKRYDYDDKDFIRLTSSISEIASNSSLVGLTMFLPFLQYLPGDPLKLKDNLNSMSKIEDHCREKLNEHKETFQENDIRDVLDSLISRQKAGHGHDKVFTDDMILQTIVDLFLGGTETTSTTLKWFVLFMIQNPEAQSHMRSEIIDVIGTERRVAYHDRYRLPFSEAVLHETLRLGNISPTTIPHVALDDIPFENFTIPKGAILIMCLDSVNNDQQTFQEPEKFDPNHFLDDKKHAVGNHNSIPFGTGRRACVAESLARMEFLFVTNLIQSFVLLPETDDVPPETHSVLGITNSPAPYKFRAISCQ